MKNLVLFLLFFLTIICNAQVKLEANKEGMYRIADDSSEWIPSGITIDIEATRYLGGAFNQRNISKAISNPGEKILTEESENALGLKLVFKKLVEVKKSFISYDSSTKNIKYWESKEVIEETSYLLISCVLSLIFMIISNISRKRNHSLYVIMWFVSFILTIFSAVLSNAMIGIVPLFFSAIAAIYAITHEVVRIENRYWQAMSVYYALMVVSLILLFV